MGQCVHIPKLSLSLENSKYNSFFVIQSPAGKKVLFLLDLMKVWAKDYQNFILWFYTPQSPRDKLKRNTRVLIVNLKYQHFCEKYVVFFCCLIKICIYHGFLFPWFNTVKYQQICGGFLLNNLSENQKIPVIYCSRYIETYFLGSLWNFIDWFLY